MFACLFACLSIYLSAYITRKPHDRTLPIFLRMLLVVMPRLSSGSVAVCYILPVFVDDVMFSYHGANGPESSTTLYSEEVFQVAVPVGRQITIAFGRVYQNAEPGGGEV